jgi:hypothetical protein
MLAEGMEHTGLDIRTTSFKSAVYPPPSEGYPWLVVSISRGKFAATPCATEAEARAVYLEKLWEHIADEHQRQRL